MKLLFDLNWDIVNQSKSIFILILRECGASRGGRAEEEEEEEEGLHSNFSGISPNGPCQAVRLLCPASGSLGFWEDWYQDLCPPQVLVVLAIFVM